MREEMIIFHAYFSNYRRVRDVRMANHAIQAGQGSFYQSDRRLGLATATDNLVASGVGLSESLDLEQSLPTSNLSHV